MDDQNFQSARFSGVFEGVSDDSFGGLLSDKLDGLHDTWDNNVLDTGVLTFGVFSDQDGVDVFVWGLVALDGLTRSDVGEKTKGSSQGQVHRLVALTDRGGQRPLKSNQVSVDRVDSRLWDGGHTVDERRSHVHRLPVDGHASSLVDSHDRVRDLFTNTVTLDERHGVTAVDWSACVLAGDLAGVCSGGGHDALEHVVVSGEEEEPRGLVGLCVFAQKNLNPNSRSRVRVREYQMALARRGRRYWLVS